jgi:phage terminase small subunit
VNRLDPPGHYDNARRAIWAGTVAALTDRGRIFTTDPDVLAAYVEQVITNRRAAALLAQTDVLIMRDGKATANPAVEVQRRSAAAIAALARTLGLNRSPMNTALAASPMSGDGRRWCDEHARDECKHNRKDGLPCHQYRLIPGLGSCRKHAGMNLADARARGQANLARIYSGGAKEIDPAGALLWELGHSAAVVEELRARVGQMAAEPGPDGEQGSGLFWGTTVRRERDGVTETEQRAGPHAILKALNEEREHLVHTAAAARATGAMEVQADAARRMAANLGRLLDAIFDGLQLTAYQRDTLIPQVVPAAIRSWELEAAPAGS